MSYTVIVLQGHSATNWKKQIKELLSEFSEQVSKQIQAGVYDEVLNETFASPHAYFCIAFDEAEKVATGMYLGTLMPTAMHRRLYIDAVVVSQEFRRQGILTQVLIPHMRKLGAELGCQAIDLTSSKPNAQSAYLAAGFESPTTAFRLTL